MTDTIIEGGRERRPDADASVPAAPMDVAPELFPAPAESGDDAVSPGDGGEDDA